MYYTKEAIFFCLFISAFVIAHMLNVFVLIPTVNTLNAAVKKYTNVLAKMVHKVCVAYNVTIIVFGKLNKKIFLDVAEHFHVCAHIDYKLCGFETSSGTKNQL